MARLPAGHLLNGRYVVDGLLGEGAMSSVYRARDQAAAGLWAIKEMTVSGQSEQERATTEALFQQEAWLLTQLVHPSIPRVVDFFSDGDHHYLVMEMVPGQTLDNLVEYRGRCHEVHILPVAIQLLSCLDYLHTHPQGPIIFRDLKPSNVMVGPDGHVKLIDFGIARLFKNQATRDTQPLGTPGFAPPEQYGSSQSTPATDLYSWAATLHYCLTAIDPEPTGTTFAAVRSVVPDVSIELDTLISNCLQHDPKARPQTAREVLDAVHALQLKLLKAAPQAPVRLDIPFFKRWFARTFSLRPRGSRRPPTY